VKDGLGATMVNLITGIKQFMKWDRCPTEQKLAEYADQQAIGSERHGIERHLAHCDRCLRQVGFLVRQVSHPTEAVPEELFPKAVAVAKQCSGKTNFSLQWITVTATGVAAVLAAVLLIPWPNQPTPSRVNHPEPAQPAAIQSTEPQVPKTEADAPILRGDNQTDATILFPHSGEVVDTYGLTVRWQSAARVLFYEVQVLSDDGDIVWETHCHSTSIRLPLRVHLVKGKAYYVRLRIHAADGSVVQSKLVDFVAG
jgi:hypothetical protein